MHDSRFYNQVIELINKDLNVADEDMALVPQKDLDQHLLREKLTAVIRHLMDTNFEKLCQAMYRMDVSEKKFDMVFTENSKEEIPEKLADLVIERELQKVHTRMLYKTKKF